jgi:signal transduction histidine kinase
MSGLSHVSPFPLDRPGAWVGGRPVAWVRTGSALVAIGYGLVGTFSLVSGLPPLAGRILELSVAAVGLAAFFLVGRSAMLASGLVLASMAIEALVSLSMAVDLGSSSSLVLVTLLVLTGALLGARAVALATGAVLALVPAILLVFDPQGPAHIGSSRLELTHLITFEVIAGSLGLMMWLGIQTFNKLLTAAEERYALERFAEVARMAALVSHEVNSPLAAVRTNLACLLDSPDASKGERESILRETAEAVQRISETIGQLRRISAGSPRSEDA